MAPQGYWLSLTSEMVDYTAQERFRGQKPLHSQGEQQPQLRRTCRVPVVGTGGGLPVQPAWTRHVSCRDDDDQGRSTAATARARISAPPRFLEHPAEQGRDRRLVWRQPVAGRPGCA